jgi:hypothetical protein
MKWAFHPLAVGMVLLSSVAICVLGLYSRREPQGGGRILLAVGACIYRFGMLVQWPISLWEVRDMVVSRTRLRGHLVLQVMFTTLLVIGCAVVGARSDVLNVDGDVVRDMLTVSFPSLLSSPTNISGHFGHMHIA